MRFTVPIHESNDCHTPAGSAAGGQFCATTIPGLKVSQSGERLDSEVGFISLNRPYKGSGPMRVEEIYVYERFRGKGWGQKLYLAAADYAKTLGYTGVWSSVDSRTPHASRAWDRLRTTGRVRRDERHIIGEKTRRLQVDVLEANDCHTPAGSPAGGQFCSKTGHPIVGADKLWASMGDSKTFVHGSRRDLGDELHGGSMFSDSPSWAAGYATTQDLEGRDWFEGHVYAMALPTGPALYVRSVHASERKLLDMAKQLNDGKEAPSLKAAADVVAAKTDLVAILAREPGGKLTGGILVRPARIVSTTDPADAVRVATRQGHMVASNVLDALKRTSGTYAFPEPGTTSAAHFYHMTPVANLPSIARTGLRPHDDGGVSLAAHIESAAWWRDYQRKTDVALLRLRRSAVPKHTLFEPEFTSEVGTSHHIKPDALEVYRHGRWEKL